MKKIIFLSIANFYFELVFHNSTEEKSYNRLKKQIHHHYSNFLLQKKPPTSTLTYTIHFYPHPPMLQINTKHILLSFFQINNKSVITFQHISIVQFATLLTYLLQKLLKKSGGFFYHASGNSTPQGVLLFTGEPGAGKSTISHLLSSKYPRIADDSIIIRRMNNTYYAFCSHSLEKIPIQKTYKKHSILGLFSLCKSKTETITSYFNSSSPNFSIFMSELWADGGKKHTQYNEVHRFIKYLYSSKKIGTITFEKNRGKVLKLF